MVLLDTPVRDVGSIQVAAVGPRRDRLTASCRGRWWIRTA